MKENLSILIEQDKIATRIREIAECIDRDFQGESLTCICVLKGAIMFTADLLKHINLPTEISYIAVSSYRNEQVSSGDIEVIMDMAHDISGKNVLLIEDIVDTGHTVKKLISILSERNPKTIKVCTMVDRPDRREVPVHIDYVGFTISNNYLVGYGLDYAEQYRNLPDICALCDIE